MSYLKEAVPFQKSNVVDQRLQKNVIPTVSPGTFGIEFEYAPDKPTMDSIDPNDYEDEIVSNMTRGHNLRGNLQAYYEWLEEKRKYSNRRWGASYQKEWDDSYGPPAADDWLEHNPEPQRDDYNRQTDSENGDQDKYDDDHSEWESNYKDVDIEYSRWSYRGMYNWLEEWAIEMIRNGEWQEYSDISIEDLGTGRVDIVNEIDNARRFIEEKLNDTAPSYNSTKDHWGVGMDAENIEIRSKHLTESELPKVERLLKDFLSHKKTSRDTSAHVHVGLPAKFDAFDIMAMSDLVDEKEIRDAIGPDRNYNAWAKLNYDLAGDILEAIGEHFKKSLELPPNRRVSEIIETGWLVKLDTLEKILKDNMKKYRGTNLAAFWDHRTIEFRYWSSEAAVSHPNTFINWIRYFLLLPKVALKRNKIVVGPGRAGSFVCSRQGASHVKIEFEDKFKESILKNYQKRMADKHQMMINLPS
jgi:hypothetical protein